METADNGVDGVGTGSEDVLESAMGATREKQAFGVKSQLVAEVVVDVSVGGLLHKQVLVALGHRVLLGDVGDDVEAIGDLAGVVDHQKTVSFLRGPLCGDTVEIAALGEKLSADGMWRDDDLGALVDAYEMLESPGMVAMSVRDKHIVHRAEVDAHLLGIADKDVAGTGVEQDAVLAGL